MQRAVLFTAHVDIPALVQQVQGQACDHDKSEHEFPHLSFSQKKALGTLNDEGQISQVSKNTHKALQPVKPVRAAARTGR
jgi:hypothetical protein